MCVLQLGSRLPSCAVSSGSHAAQRCASFKRAALRLFTNLISHGFLFIWFLLAVQRYCSAATVAPLVCRRFAQLCEIGPIDFLRSLHVDSTIQGDFGHVVRSSVGCLGSEIFWVMCLNLHIPDNAEKHCFEHKSQFLILKYWDSAFPSNTLPKEREFRVP